MWSLMGFPSRTMQSFVAEGDLNYGSLALEVPEENILVRCLEIIFVVFL